MGSGGVGRCGTGLRRPRAPPPSAEPVGTQSGQPPDVEPSLANFSHAAIREALTKARNLVAERVTAEAAVADAQKARPAAHGVKVGEPLPTLAEYYRGGIRFVVEPGSAFAYSNHGFATLGQIVEDVWGMPLDCYLRAHIFEPLGMTDTDLVRSVFEKSRLATGYDLGPSGAKAVTDREWVTRGAEPPTLGAVGAIPKGREVAQIGGDLGRGRA